MLFISPFAIEMMMILCGETFGIANVCCADFEIHHPISSTGKYDVISYKSNKNDFK